eukprot:CAMPEP_0114541848 /NCGR_PEP_ID=MMETSP0114-20121206/1524_1 /TAXON_ID=31324 /ORGANISM="Goniomonas sp, Strain m" /LENGTH=72 /DNA_ID=CAMNT_0001726113 /DNA_START=155 /DNA_END=373 /DNA_ORIENTATION=-
MATLWNTSNNTIIVWPKTTNSHHKSIKPAEEDPPRATPHKEPIEAAAETPEMGSISFQSSGITTEAPLAPPE